MIIFDLDGTLADTSHRDHHILQEPKDWDAWHAEVAGDLPFAHVVRVYHALRFAGEEVEIWTGRMATVEEETRDWLYRHLWTFEECPLQMRPPGDHTEDVLLKERWMLARREKPRLVFEDRTRVVEMWRRHGVPCFQVRKGDF